MYKINNIVGILLVTWLLTSTIFAIDSLSSKTYDRVIVYQCKDKGYIAIGQTVITCSIEKDNK